MLLQVILELGDTDAIDASSAFVLYHPLIRKFQVAAFAHGFHQPACLLRRRFRPQMVRRFRLGTHGSALRIPSGLFHLRPVLPTGFCLL